MDAEQQHDKDIAELRDMMEQFCNEIAGLTRATSALQRIVDRHERELTQERKSAVNGIHDIMDSIERLTLLIDGDPRRDVKGIRNRLEEMEKSVREMTQYRQQVKWILIGMGLVGGTQAGALITVLAKAFGAIP